jgi:cytochrome c nitrite reductase small subunit
MSSQYDSWQKSTHHTVASCVDCHLPHSFFDKYLAKVEHGWKHSKGFTLQNFFEPIRISDKTAGELQDNCIRCHSDFVHGQIAGHQETLDCRHCHSTVGHGVRAGLGGPFRPDEMERTSP